MTDDERFPLPVTPPPGRSASSSATPPSPSQKHSEASTCSATKKASQPSGSNEENPMTEHEEWCDNTTDPDRCGCHTDLTERITIAKQLNDLADEYAIEAKHWGPTVHAEMEISAAILYELARRALRSLDIDQAIRVTDAARTNLDLSVAVRRLRNAVYPNREDQP